MDDSVKDYVDRFHQDGFLVIGGVLTPEECDVLKDDIDARSKDARDSFSNRNVEVYHKMFEWSQAHHELFYNDLVLSIAESLINDHVIPEVADEGHVVDFTGANAAMQCHVIHNSAIVVRGGSGGINKWHQDDPPHYIVRGGEIPTNVHLPVLSLTANYYLTDVDSVEDGPTLFVPGSHLFGKPCPSQIDEGKYPVYTCLAPRGSVIMFNCQTWHRGSANTSERTRYVSQVSYARRMIGHKYFPFMNYQMPQYVIDRVGDDKQKKRLLGFLGHGPYA